MDQVAEHLGTDKLTIMRLIARGRLTGSRLREKGKWIVLANDLDRIVQNLSGGFNVPPHDNAWFKTEYVSMNALNRDLKHAAASQVHGTLQRNKSGQPILNDHLPLSPAPQNVLSRPANAARSDVEYRNAAKQALVDKLRDLAKRSASATSADGLFPTPIQTLYSNRKNFNAIVEQALNRYREMNFFFVHEYVVNDTAGHPRNYRLQCFLSCLTMHTDPSRIVDLAF